MTSVSVVIPTYNRCDVVERTLRHLLAQDHTDL
jgi:glycosyltransferase involved in cell wall biosynthesis